MVDLVEAQEGPACVCPPFQELRHASTYRVAASAIRPHIAGRDAYRDVVAATS